MKNIQLIAFNVNDFEINYVKLKLSSKKYEKTNFDLKTYRFIKNSWLQPVVLINNWFVSIQEYEWVKRVFNIVPEKFNFRIFDKTLN